MTQPLSTATSPLLEKFKSRTPGEIHSVAAKRNLEQGFVACKANTVTAARWNHDKSALQVSFAGQHETTLMLEGWQIFTKCSCQKWQPARNCPHVVIAWATIKHLVSPETLKHIQFNQQMLRDMQSYLEAEAGDQSSIPATKSVKGTRPASKPVADEKKPKYRLLIEKSPYGSGVQGTIKQGETTVNSWTSHGIPVELAHFLATYRSFNSSQRYFEMFMQLTGGKFPIVFRLDDGSEKQLFYTRNHPCSAGIELDITGTTIHISRCQGDGTPLDPDSVITRQLLYDLGAGELRPVEDSGAWDMWETIFENLDGVEENRTDGFDDDYEEFDEFDELDDFDGFDEESFPSPISSSEIICCDRHTITVPLDFFNQAVLRFTPHIINNPDAAMYFRCNGRSTDEHQISQQTYLLDIPGGFSAATTPLLALSEYNGEHCSFSSAGFWIFNQYERMNLPSPLRTKKRVKAIIEAAFQLLDETRTSVRNSIIRSVTASPDFEKRDIRMDGKDLLLKLDEIWKRKHCIIKATANGWLFLQDDLHAQAAMLRIAYEMFGLEAFDNGSCIGELVVNTVKLQKQLPALIERLQQAGYSLRVTSAPVAQGKFEFSLDASSSSIDWFELKPEIRCNGELLSPEELQGLFEGGMLHKNGTLILIDDASSLVLSMFADAMPQQSGKKKKKEQEFVRVPRLQILDWLQMRRHGVDVRLAPDDAALLDNLLNFSSIPPRPLPREIKAELRHYQRDAWHWLAFLYEHRFGACLADDMGLGKTLQGITLLAGIMSGELPSRGVPGAPHLVVAPPSLLFNWEAELARFLPSARVMLYSGNGRSTGEFRNHDVIITSYGIVQRDWEKLAEEHFNVLIFDEAQTVKNLQAATTNAVRKLCGAFTLALTGTPVENHLGEYFAIMDLCLPGLLGTREEFSRKLSKDSEHGVARLIGRTRPFVLRRTKELIAGELPPKIEMDIPLELTVKQKALYQRTVEEVRGQVKEAYDSHASAQARIIALTAILRLRQICLAPVLASAGADRHSPKLDFLTEQLAELRDEGHSALVFSQFTGYLDLIEKELQEHDFPCLRLDGSTPVPQRKKLVQSFQNATEPSVFLISLKAGGKGLNLTRATYVYHMDPWWNPAVENQASDRAHRIGQTAQVTITRLIMKHTIEEKMMALKEQKTQLYKAILEEGTGGGGAGLTREDFDFLLG